MISITQQARRVLMDLREERAADGRVSRLRMAEHGEIRIERAELTDGDVTVADAAGALLVMDLAASRDRDDIILHYRTAADTIEGGAGWVLLRPRGSPSRVGLADSLPNNEAAPQAAAGRPAVLRALGTLLQALR
jgi:hypothetical protein